MVLVLEVYIPPKRGIVWNLVRHYQVVQKTSSLAMHAERTENLRQRELKLFFFEFHAWYY